MFNPWTHIKPIPEPEAALEIETVPPIVSAGDRDPCASCLGASPSLSRPLFRGSRCPAFAGSIPARALSGSGAVVKHGDHGLRLFRRTLRRWRDIEVLFRDRKVLFSLLKMLVSALPNIRQNHLKQKKIIEQTRSPYYGKGRFLGLASLLHAPSRGIRRARSSLMHPPVLVYVKLRRVFLQPVAAA